MFKFIKGAVITCHSHSAAIARARAFVGTIKGCLAGVLRACLSSIIWYPACGYGG